MPGKKRNTKVKMPQGSSVVRRTYSCHPRLDKRLVSLNSAMNRKRRMNDQLDYSTIFAALVYHVVCNPADMATMFDAFTRSPFCQANKRTIGVARRSMSLNKKLDDKLTELGTAVNSGRRGGANGPDEVAYSDLYASMLLWVQSEPGRLLQVLKRYEEFLRLIGKPRNIVSGYGEAVTMEELVAALKEETA